MTTQPRQPINWTYLATAIVVRMFMFGAAAVSFTHIIATSHALGLGVEAWTVPFLVDGLAVLGLIGRSARFAASTQRAGLWFATGAGTLSLACNVYAGHNLGQRLYGVLVVAGFVATEWYASKLRPAPAAAESTTCKLDPAEAAARAAKARATRARNKAAAMTPAQKAAATRKANRLAELVAAVDEAFDPADAPVSPAVA
ncbi:MAG TPA: hypothetical protein VFE14_05750 [Micromonosporaceae bacterium]|nr:hypothetical protein [Micromonosporaceae bacterium]